MEEVKKLIRSILISSPNAMSISKLAFDYNSEIGEPIPFRRFEYNDLETFLLNIPDTVRVQGSGREALLHVVVTSKVAHIDRLISNQRPKRSRPQPRFRSRVPEQPRGRYRQPVSHNPPTQMHRYLPRNVNVRWQHPQATPNWHHPQPTPNWHHPQPTPNWHHPQPTSDWHQPQATPDWHSAALNGSQRHSTSALPQINPQPSLTMMPNQRSSTANQSEYLHSPTGAIPKQRCSTPNEIPSLLSLNCSISNRNTSNTVITKDVPSSNHFMTNSDNRSFSPEQKSGGGFVENGELAQQSSKIPTSEIPHCSKDDVYYSDDEDSLSDDNVILNSSMESVNYRVPLAVQQNLEKFIATQESGIWCCNLPQLYFKMFNKQLDFIEYGYKSLSLMCMDLKDIFHCVRPDRGDFKLFDKRKPLPPDYDKDLLLNSSFILEAQSKKLDCNTEPALLDAEEFIDRREYPPCVMELSETIEKQFLPENSRENDYVDVVVGEVYDPSKFWVILNTHYQLLNELMDELQTYYATTYENLEIPPHMIQVGLFCVAKYNNEYHRAIIINTLDDKSKVKVFYADYGSVCPVNIKGLCYLHRQFMHLPLQAIRARLGGIWPTTAHTPWSITASSRVLQFVKDKVLVAQLHRIHAEKQLIEVLLADTSTDVDIWLNDTLVNEGYAFFTHTEQLQKPLNRKMLPKYKYIHLFPRFYDLEHGNVPSAAEIIRLNRFGVQSEYMYPHYFEDTPTEDDIESDKENDFFLHGQKPIESPTEKHPTEEPQWTNLLKQECPEPNSNLSLPSSSPTSPLVLPTPPLGLPTPPLVLPTSTTTTIKPPPGFEGVQPNLFFNKTTVAPQFQESPQTSLNEPPVFSQFNQPLVNSLLNQPTLAHPAPVPTSQSFLQNAQVATPLDGVVQQLLLTQFQSNYFGSQRMFADQPQFLNHLLSTQRLLQSTACALRCNYKNILLDQLMRGRIGELYNINSVLYDASAITMGNGEVYTLFSILCNALGSSHNAAIVPVAGIVDRLLTMLSDVQMVKLISQVGKFNQYGALCEQFVTDVVNNSLSNSLRTQATISENKMNESTQVAEKHDGILLADVTPQECRRRPVEKLELEGAPVHVLWIKDKAYIPVNDIMQFTTCNIPVTSVRKFMVLCDSCESIVNIRLNNHKELAEELLKYKILDSVFDAVPVESVPKVVDILGSKTNLFTNYNAFLKRLYFQ